VQEYDQPDTSEISLDCNRSSWTTNKPVIGVRNTRIRIEKVAALVAATKCTIVAVFVFHS
jgi:hypothetical protein